MEEEKEAMVGCQMAGLPTAPNPGADDPGVPEGEKKENTRKIDVQITSAPCNQHAIIGIGMQSAHHTCRRALSSAQDTASASWHIERRTA